jgi:CRISPR-associated protein Cmr1
MVCLDLNFLFVDSHLESRQAGCQPESPKAAVMSIRHNLPACPAAPQVPPPSHRREYDIQIITPLFGGGSSTQVNDPDFPIRPTSIRGQLQFWWRATVGAQYNSKEDLRNAQSAVWGDTSRASRVRIRVDQVQAEAPTPIWNAPFRSTALTYALFPFHPKLTDGQQQNKLAPASCIHKARFRLTINFDSSIDFGTQVEPALWAWLNFGGLGSRTRRGCGSLFCSTLAPEDTEKLKEAWQRYMPQLFPVRDWPTLASSVCVRTGKQNEDAIWVWNSVIRDFFDFRQGLKQGRNKNQQSNGPGRSRFPEPETIRRVTNQRPHNHPRMPHIPDDAFPRAEFGLPILFPFKGSGEPRDIKLYPASSSHEKSERMASPLILKPLALKNGKAIPLILRLQTPLLTAVDLRRGTESLPLPLTTSICAPRLSTYQNSPLALSPDGSAIEAFLAYAQNQGFKKVTR